MRERDEERARRMDLEGELDSSGVQEYACTQQHLARGSFRISGRLGRELRCNESKVIELHGYDYMCSKMFYVPYSMYKWEQGMIDTALCTFCLSPIWREVRHGCE